MKVLVACEESQQVCTAFRKRGHEAYSCDIQVPSGGHPEWHILGDVLPLIDGHCRFRTMDGAEHHIDGEWDLMIAHRPVPTFPMCRPVVSVSTAPLRKRCANAGNCAAWPPCSLCSLCTRQSNE